MRLLFAHDHRILRYNDEYYSNGSFSSDVFKRYTAIFDRVSFLSRGIEVKERPSNMSKANTADVKFVSVPNFLSLQALFKKNNVKKIIQREVNEADYIIARLPSFIGASAIKYAKEKNKPYLIEMVADPWHAHWNHSVKGKVIAPFSYFSTRKLIDEADYVIYVTNSYLQNRYPTKGKSTSCSNVALKNANENVLLNRIVKINSINMDKKIIIGTTAAVNVRFKGQQYIIQALGKLKQEGNTNFEYHLVGGGDQSYLKAIANKYNVTNQIKFIGTLSHEKIFDWLDNIDIYTQPSRQEGLPRALVEAMSRGIPAFGANTAGIPELLDNEFIFSNSKQNIEEICIILKKFNKDKMLTQATINFNESKKYKSEIIEDRRKEFILDFRKNSCK